MNKIQATIGLIIREHLSHFPWHIFLVTIYFILYGYNLNLELFLLSQVLTILAYFLIATLLLYLTLRMLTEADRASVIGLVCVFAFFLYGHLYELLLLKYPDYIPIFPNAYIILSIIIITLLVFTKYKLSEINRSLKIIIVILGLINFIQLVPQIFADRQALNHIYDPLNLPIELPETIPEQSPDVYYLMLDGYPSNSSLQNHWGIDNSYFTDQLEARGFYVAYDSQANYTFTFPSITSSLNMDFVHNLMPFNADLGYRVLDPYLINSRVARIFQGIGYDYIYVSNGFTFSNSIIADMTIEVAGDGSIIILEGDAEAGKRSFWKYISQTTLMRLIDPSMTFSDNTAFASWDSNQRFHSNFRALDEIPTMEAPTFTYFHILKPHLPITMYESGEAFNWNSHYSSQSDFWRNQEIHFAEQLIYVNARIIDSIDQLLYESETPPIIIIQGDHGIEVERMHDFRTFNNPTPILNAYYFPDEDYSNLSSNITPVNSFRVVFNQFFGEEYVMLDDSLRYYNPIRYSRHLFFEEIPDGLFDPPFE